MLNGAFEFSPSVPPLYKALFSAPLAAFIACMACHAHRVMTTASHYPADTNSTITYGGIRFAPSDESSDGTTSNRRMQTGVESTSRTRNSFGSELC